MRSEREILADVKVLATEYYQTTGKPLGVAGEIAEYEAASRLGLELAPPRTYGYDAVRAAGATRERIQIKGRRVSSADRYRGQIPKINLDGPFESVVLVLLDQAYNPIEIWEATRDHVERRLRAPGSKARNERGSLAISQFKSIAFRIWPNPTRRA